MSTVDIAPAEAQISLGQQQVFLTTAYDRANNRVAAATFTFTSSNLNVVRIDANGIAVGVSPGFAIITARTGTGATAKSAIATLTVTAPPTPWEPARPRGPDGTLSLVGNIPPIARVTVDGRNASVREKLPPGRHRVRVEADGFQRYEATVSVGSNMVTTFNVQLHAATAVATPPPGGSAAPAADCSSPQVGLRNANSACYDVRPAPRAPPAIPTPASCAGVVTPASALLRVSASGEVETASLLGRSNCAAFGDMAVPFARDLAFQPATKNGQPVAAWIALLIRPSPR